MKKYGSVGKPSLKVFIGEGRVDTIDMPAAGGVRYQAKDPRSLPDGPMRSKNDALHTIRTEKGGSI